MYILQQSHLHHKQQDTQTPKEKENVFLWIHPILFNLIIVSQFHSEDQVVEVRVVLMPSRQKHQHNKQKAAESASLDPFHLIGQRGSEKEGR